MVERMVFGPNGPYNYKDTETHGEFDTIFALFLRDRSLVIQEEQKHPGIHGGYYYKTINSYFYKVYTNRHGEKYLRSFKKTAKGRISIQTSDTMRSDPFLFSGSFHRFCPEMGAVIEDHLSKMLGWEFKRVGAFSPVQGAHTSPTQPEWLCFPFLRSPENYSFADTVVSVNSFTYGDRVEFFKLAKTGPRGLYKAFRECQTQDEFLSQLVYKSAIADENDLTLLKEDPSLLKIVSKIDFRMSVTEAKAAGYIDLLSKYYEVMSSGELLSFKFLLANLPKDRVAEVYDVIVKLDAARREWNEKNRIKLNPHTQGIGGHYDCLGNMQTIEAAFRTLPMKDRRKFAEAFLTEFKTEFEEASVRMSEMDQTQARKEEKIVYIKVADAHMRAFSSLQSESRITERCVSSIKKLFGMDLHDMEDDLDIYKTGFGSGASFELFGITVRRYQQKESLFSLILKDPDLTPVWNEMFRVDAGTHLLRHLDERIESKGTLVFAADFEKVMLKIAGLIDAGLTKVGQDLTPENRIRYLKTNVFDRKYKINWRYYQLGVRPKDVHWFKKAKIRSKKDVAFWVETQETLPEETYMELLQVAAGVDRPNAFADSF